MYVAPRTTPVPHDRLLQIGELAELTGLSLRTLRYYEEVSLVTPAQRTDGGFRLYDAEAVERIRIVMAMKPLGYQLEDMRQLVDACRRLETGAIGQDCADDRDIVASYERSVEEHVDSLMEIIVAARQFSARLRTLAQQQPAAVSS